jgi:TonB family protein
MICNNCGSEIASINRFCPKCGSPVQYQAPATPPLYSSPQAAMPVRMSGPMYPPRKSGCGKIILILAIIVVVLGAGIGAALYFGYRYTEKALKSSEPYTIAVKALKEDPHVKEELGEINDTGFPIGAFSSDANGTGKAAFVMSVQGSRSSGQYQVALIRNNSIWRLEQASVKTATGVTIHLVTSRVLTVYSTNDNGNTNGNKDNLASGAILNDKATSLPQPVYPSIAKQAHASGTVIVQVTVNEQGKVVSAVAISGHPLLQASAVAAARQATFDPRKVGRTAVKFSGIIKYEFTAD